MEGEKRFTSGRIPIHLGFIGRPGPSNDPCRHRHLPGTCVNLSPELCELEADIGFLHGVFIFCAIAHKLGVPSGLQRLWTWIWSPDLWRHGFGSESFALLPLVSWNAEQAMGRGWLPINRRLPTGPHDGPVRQLPIPVCPSLAACAGHAWNGSAAPTGHVLGAIALLATATTVRMWT